MKIKCEYIVVCGNYNCEHNSYSRCIRDVIALDANGQCALCKPWPEPISQDCSVRNKD